MKPQNHRALISLITFMVLFLITSTNLAQANYEVSTESTARVLNKMAGDWYDSNGKLTMTIQDGYINDCQVTNAFDFAGGNPGSGIFRIIENTGYRDIKIEWLTFSKDPSHQYIVIDSKTTLRKTQKPQYFESVGGIYLGISKNELVRLYGQPTKIANYDLWHYDKDGFTVSFNGNMAVGITIYKYGNRHFDRTGLNCNNSIASYYREYNLNRMPTMPTGKNESTGAYSIGHGEYLFFDDYPNSVQLTIFYN